MSLPRHVLVTGGCGFLGQHIVRQLRARYPNTFISVADLAALKWVQDVQSSPLSFSTTDGYEQVQPQQAIGPPPSDRVRYVDCNITDRETVAKLLTDRIRTEGLPAVDVIIHTASPHLSMPRELLRNVNVDGTRILLEEGKKAGVSAFVYTSSASVVMDKSLAIYNANEDRPAVLNEDESPEYYSLTKAQAEALALAANDRQSRFLTCAIRPAGIFGEGDRQVLPGLIDASRAGKTKVIIGDDLNRFDFTYVGNLAHAHLLAMEKLLLKVYQLEKGEDEVGLQTGEKPSDRDSGHALSVTSEKPVDGQAFFITNDEPIYFWDFARAVWYRCGDYRPRWKQIALPAGFALGIASVAEFFTRALGLPPPKLTRAKAQFSAITRVYDITRAKERLGYRPSVSLDEGLKRSLRWHIG